MQQGDVATAIVKRDLFRSETAVLQNATPRMLRGQLMVETDEGACREKRFATRASRYCSLPRLLAVGAGMLR
jgi:hypothetical protein